jgi:hypothetical protein
MRIFFLVIILFLISTFSFADSVLENKKKIGGPKSDYVLERKEFNFNTSVKDRIKNWIITKKTGEIVRYGIRR